MDLDKILGKLESLESQKNRLIAPMERKEIDRLISLSCKRNGRPEFVPHVHVVWSEKMISSVARCELSKNTIVLSLDRLREMPGQIRAIIVHHLCHLLYRDGEDMHDSHWQEMCIRAGYPSKAWPCEIEK